jgi:NAD-dependent deacetylase sirtuin 4
LGGGVEVLNEKTMKKTLTTAFIQTRILGRFHGSFRAFSTPSEVVKSSRPLFEIPTSGIEEDGKEFEKQASTLAAFFKGEKRVLVITGAGLSTESGIPDYRSPDGSYSRGHKPILHSEFVTDTVGRKRYWARSIIGYAWFDAAEPNIGHKALEKLTRRGVVGDIITQNVDSLHYKSGTRDVIELHGTNRSCECLSCGFVEPRPDFQDRIRELNKSWIERYLPTNFKHSDFRADGDAVLGDVDYSTFEIPGCLRCGDLGMMKPSVVFFGANLKPAVRQRSMDAVRNSSKILMVGTSAQVFSVYRLCLLAKELEKPLGILNIGETRADPLASFKIEGQCGSMLHKLASRVCQQNI